MTHHWDYLILTASNHVQAAAYEYQLESRRKSGRLADFRQSLVVPDLEGKRIGSGGSTLLCLLEVLARELSPLPLGEGQGVRESGAGPSLSPSGPANSPSPRPSQLRAEIEQAFRRLRVLILHAGGDSRRLPAYGPCGKIFVPVPGPDEGTGPIGAATMPARRTPAGRAGRLDLSPSPGPTVFDHLLATFARLPPPPAGCGQVVVVAGDALIRFDPSLVRLVPEALTALGCYATPEESSKHGVFCGASVQLTSKTRQAEDFPHTVPVRLFLQKPSPARQAEAGALNTEGRSILDVAVMSFGAEVAAALLKAVEVEPDEQGRWKWSKAMHQTIITRGLDLYREICCALGSEATPEHLIASAASSGSTWDEHSLRRLFDVLHPIPFHVQVLPECGFLHFGTTRQLITSGLELLRQTGQALPTGNLLSLNNTFSAGGEIRGGNSWVEACRIAAPLCLAGQNVVIGVDVDEPLLLPEAACLDLVPGRDRQGNTVWFVRCYHVRDTFKDPVDSGGTLCGRPLAQWLADVGARPEDVWDPGVAVAKRTLWDARVFPAVARPGDYRAWLWMLDPATSSQTQRQSLLAADRYPVSEMAWLADQEEFVQRRQPRL